MPFAPDPVPAECCPAMESQAPSHPRNHPLPIPTSFGGVAAVAEAHAGVLLVWQTVLALGTALLSLWAFEMAWGRALRHAVTSLPDQARIHQGALEWPNPQALVLYQGPFVAFVVDPDDRREVGLATDVTVSLEARALALRSFLGWSTLPYPPDFSLSLNRLDMTGAIAAWSTPFHLALGAAIFFSLFLSWLLLAFTYGTVVWIAAWAIGRPTPFHVARRLAAASLLPGCLLMAAALFLYTTRQLGLEGLLLAWPLHIVLGWLYCAGAWARLVAKRPQHAPPDSNPFATDTDTPDADTTTPDTARSPHEGPPANPFRHSG